MKKKKIRIVPTMSNTKMLNRIISNSLHVLLFEKRSNLVGIALYHATYTRERGTSWNRVHVVKWKLFLSDDELSFFIVEIVLGDFHCKKERERERREIALL